MKNLWNKIKELKSKITKLIKGLSLPAFAFIVGFLGAFAGSEGTSLLWRRAGISALVTITTYLKLGTIVGWVDALWTITVFTMWGFFSMGYGIPDWDYPENDLADEGSSLGRFWTMNFRKFFEQDIEGREKAHRFGDYFTRGTIGLLTGLSMIAVPILKGNWIVFGIGCLAITLTNALVTWRDLGTKELKIGNKNFYICYSDVIYYSAVGMSAYCIIFYKIL